MKIKKISESLASAMEAEMHSSIRSKFSQANVGNGKIIYPFSNEKISNVYLTTKSSELKHDLRYHKLGSGDALVAEIFFNSRHVNIIYRNIKNEIINEYFTYDVFLYNFYGDSFLYIINDDDINTLVEKIENIAKEQIK